MLPRIGWLNVIKFLFVNSIYLMCIFGKDRYKDDLTSDFVTLKIAEN